MVFDRLRRRLEWNGTSGSPRSSNAASSLHLFWDAPGPWVEAHAVVEIVEPPRVRALSFWALQVGFTDPRREDGGDAGAAHLGLQWHPEHPHSTAVNWGGYRAGGGELDGSPSALPSATGNPNTRDLAWSPGRRYRLRVRRGQSVPPDGGHAWAGEVTDLETGASTVVRDLWTGGTHLAGPMVWSEIFARCDDPRASVRWSELGLVDDAGRAHAVDAVTVNYQAVTDGGCVTTDSSPGGGGIVQATGIPRATPQGSRLSLPGPVGGDAPT